MLKLNEAQLKERKIVLGHFLKAFWRERPWITKREQAVAQFQLYVEADPMILRTINAMAATQNPTSKEV